MTIDENEVYRRITCLWMRSTWEFLLKHVPYNAQFSLKKYDLMIKAQLEEEAKKK